MKIFKFICCGAMLALGTMGLSNAMADSNHVMLSINNNNSSIAVANIKGKFITEYKAGPHESIQVPWSVIKQLCNEQTRCNALIFVKKGHGVASAMHLHPKLAAILHFNFKKNRMRSVDVAPGFDLKIDSQFPTPAVELDGK